MLMYEESYSSFSYEESNQPDEFPILNKDVEPDIDGSRPDLHDLARCPSQQQHNEADSYRLKLERQIDEVVNILPDVIAYEQTARTTSKRPREPNEDEQTSKKHKVSAPSKAAEAETDYVRMCRHILESTNPLLDEQSIRDLLQRVFVKDAAGWEEKLNSPDRAGFIESMCKTRNAFVRLPFCLLRFIDYLKTPEGRDAWERREAKFQLMFGDTICRVLANRGAQAQSDEMIRQNHVFTQSLYDSF
eukprot:gene16854-12064_t